jgi:tetratricopeptide (TPR) repeat protein
VDNIILASKHKTGLARKEINLIGFAKKDRMELIELLSARFNIELNKEIKEKIQTIAEGHPVSTELLVKNYEIIDFNKVKEFKPTDFADSSTEQAEEFLKRVIQEILNKEARLLLKTLSVINTDLELNIDRRIVEKIYNTGPNNRYFTELINTGMLKKKENKEGIYEFTFRHIQEAIRDDRDKNLHENAIKYYKTKEEICGVNDEDIVEILFHEANSYPSEKLVDKFTEIGNIEFPIHYCFKRLIEIGETLNESLEVKKKACFLNTMGVIYRNLGLYNQATVFLEQAFKIRRQTLSYEHIDNAESLHNLAALSYLKGDFRIAEEMFREALEIQRKLLGEEHSDIATSLNDLAMTCKAQGKFDEAEPMYREALMMNRKLFGEDHPKVAQIINNLGMFLYRKGEYNEAELLFREALKKNRELLGKEHPEVSTNLNNLALVLRDKGDYITAEQLFRQVLVMDRKFLGNDHPYVSTTLINLASCLNKKGKYHEAEINYLKSLEILKKTFPDGHWEIGYTKSLYASSLVKMGRFSEAEALLIESYPIIMETFGEKHRRTLTVLKNMNELYNAWGKPGKELQTSKILAGTDFVDERPIILLIMDKDGIPYFNHSFVENWDFSDLFSSFISAFNTFSSEIFSKSIDKIKIGENVILVNPVEPFLACYVVKGQTFEAQEKLYHFSDAIKENGEIWEALNKAVKTCELLDFNKPQSLGIIVDQIFVS